MSPIRSAIVRAGLLSLLICSTVGCRSTAPTLAKSSSAAQESLATAAPHGDPAAEVRSAAHQEIMAAPTIESIPAQLSETTVLIEDELVAEVIARNPNIQAMTAAWRAAAARYPQEISLDDPMFGVMVGPGSFGSDEVHTAYTLEASQKLPWHGKRQLRGQIARAEASAAFQDVGEARLRITEAAKFAYYDFYLARRMQALNEENLSLLQEFRSIANRNYETGIVKQQDVLMADVEVAGAARRQLEIRRMDRVARARINTLLRLAPDAPLPSPPDEIPIRHDLPSAESLRSLAVAQRPELAAQAARIRAERYAVALACKEFYPDFEVIARYDTFWQEEPLRSAVGVNLNLPLQREKRRAAVREAMARITQRQAELEEKADAIQYDVQAAYERAKESAETLALFEQKILPAARASIESARSSYITGELDFLRLVEAQRQLITLQEQSFETTAEYLRRLAELERAVGSSISVQ